MSLSSAAVSRVPSLVFAAGIGELGRVLEPEVNACILRRGFSSDARAALDGLANQGIEREADVSAAGGAVLALLEGVPSAAREVLARDLPALVGVFLALTGTRSVRARLLAVGCDSCRKFHVDYVGLRMLVTYSGPGTEVVDDAHARRAHIGRPELSFDEANAAIVPRREQVVSASAGDVVVLKGEAFHRNTGRGAVHRSPPIEGLGVRRLLFKLDVPGCAC